MIDENKTNTPATDVAPAAPKPVPKPAPKPRDPYIRAENEDAAYDVLKETFAL